MATHSPSLRHEFYRLNEFYELNQATPPHPSSPLAIIVSAMFSSPRQNICPELPPSRLRFRRPCSKMLDSQVRRSKPIANRIGLDQLLGETSSNRKSICRDKLIGPKNSPRNRLDGSPEPDRITPPTRNQQGLRPAGQNRMKLRE